MNRLAALLLIVLTAASSAAQSVVTLRSVARIDADQPLTLGDVALVQGDAALTLVPLMLGDRHVDARRRRVVTTDDLSASLRAAGIRAHEVSLRGHECEILVRPAAATPDRQEPGEAAPPDPTRESTGQTVLDHVRVRLEQLLGVSGDDLELTPDPRDAGLLATPSLGWTVEVRATGFSRRTPLRITLYGEDGSVREDTVRIGIRTRREIARVRHTTARGTRLDLDDLLIERVWLHPDEQPVPVEEAAGLVLRTRLDAGEMLRRADVETPVAIEKGDIVVVHVVTGTVVLRREARALGDGRPGETVEFEPVGAAGGRFAARVESPGRAIVLLDRGPADIEGDDS
ncbi:MAG: flagella basal body P-ring formation protein FlgA [Phycisphaerales bacterium]